MESHKSQAHAHPRESINSVRVLRVKTLWQAPGPPRVPRAEAACEPLAHNSPILSVTERLFMLSFTLLNHRGETLLRTFSSATNSDDGGLSESVLQRQTRCLRGEYVCETKNERKR